MLSCLILDTKGFKTINPIGEIIELRRILKWAKKPVGRHDGADNVPDVQVVQRRWLVKIKGWKDHYSISSIVIARKNMLFTDTPAGAHARAMLFSMIETAKANGHNTHHYLSLLLSELPSATDVEQIDKLLPWHLRPEQASIRYNALPRP